MGKYKYNSKCTTQVNWETFSGSGKLDRKRIGMLTKATLTQLTMKALHVTEIKLIGIQK